MDQQHPVPRQITSFEFKLIGFMTLKQFIYLLIFFPFGYIVYRLFPIPFLNIVAGISIAVFGAALAFIPVNDRPLDIWVKNLLRRLTSPTQYIYQKNNDAASLLKTREEEKEDMPQQIFTAPSPPISSSSQVNQVIAPTSKIEETPFLMGVVKNSKDIPLPEIMVSIKDQKNTIIRLLKTNIHGVFTTYHPFEGGEYIFEIRDPSRRYFFDRMTIKVEKQNTHPIEFVSKELL